MSSWEAWFGGCGRLFCGRLGAIGTVGFGAGGGCVLLAAEGLWP